MKRISSFLQKEKKKEYKTSFQRPYEITTREIFYVQTGLEIKFSYLK